MTISARAREVFLEAQEKPADTRSQFVTDACGSDSALLAEVASLLEAANNSQNYFEQFSKHVGLPAWAEEDVLPPNKIINHWRLLKLLGRGGMGSVYLAERADHQYEQHVAIKMLPLGLDNESAKSQFLNERQILAKLVHDNIARLLDGGVSDEGTPYFVMDYVPGVPIDVYCEEHDLSVKQRLRLVLSVAEAVQYAHQNLIIHRTSSRVTCW